MRYIISANKKSVNYVGNRHHSPLATIVHGVFNAPVKNVQTLLDAKAAPHDIENKHALCIVAGTHKYRTTPQAQDNAKKLSLLLMKYRYTICRDASCKYAKKFASPFLEKN
jgi:hypothetical protein